MHIVFPSDSSVRGLSILHERVAALEHVSNDSVALDLSGVRQFTPFTACYLAMVADRIARRIRDGEIRKGEILAPSSGNALHQFEYLGLKTYLAGTRLTRSAGVPTVPMTHLMSADYDVAFKIAGLVRDAYHLSEAHFYLTSLCLKELLQNSLEHALSSAGVYACAYFVKTRRLVRISVLDCGIGVRAHLSRSPLHSNVTSDRQALALAIQKGVSGGTKQSRGLGLHYIRVLLRDIGGVLTMASGDALMVHLPEDRNEFGLLAPRFDGTVVSIEFRAAKDYRFKLDDYEE